MITQTTMVQSRARTRLAGGLLLAALASAATGCSGSESSDGDADGAVNESSPVTLVGACSQLVGPGATLVDDALAAGDAVVENGGAQADVDRAAAAQQAIFTYVSDGPDALQDPVGVLVDYLDDPMAFETPEGLDESVADAVTDIEKACAP